MLFFVFYFIIHLSKAGLRGQQCNVISDHTHRVYFRVKCYCQNMTTKPQTIWRFTFTSFMRMRNPKIMILRAINYKHTQTFFLKIKVCTFTELFILYIHASLRVIYFWNMLDFRLRCFFHMGPKNKNTCNRFNQKPKNYKERCQWKQK